jgi:dTDP-4-dehydrorhamnose reductase
MIVGRGLIATAFRNSFFDSPPYVVFASGVSNSTEVDEEAFAREKTLLNEYVNKNTTLIYFSTTSIFDPTKTTTPYIQHKVSIEKLILDTAESFLIVRLPILVGHTPNPYTLINFLANAILEKKQITLHAKACRHLLDIDDLVPMLMPYGNDPLIRKVINMPGSAKITVPELVNKLETVLHKKGNFTWEDTGACYEIPADSGETIYLTHKHYVEEVLIKYLG